MLVLLAFDLREGQSDMEQRRLHELDTRKYREHRLDGRTGGTNDSSMDSAGMKEEGIQRTDLSYLIHTENVVAAMSIDKNQSCVGQVS